MAEPRWIAKARSYVGVREAPGKRHNPTILHWWKLIRAPFTDDETPWCAGFVGGVLEESNIRSSRSAAARSYLHWGFKLPHPAVGCIVVFSRGNVNGHVGFVVGQDRAGNLMVLGGNQGDAVNIKPFSNSRVLGYRWPANEPLPKNYTLPFIGSNGRVSTREAKLEGDSSPAVAAADMSGVGASGAASDCEGGLVSKIKKWMHGTNAGVGAGGLVAAATGFADWKVAAVIVGAVVAVGLVIYFTSRR